MSAQQLPRPAGSGASFGRFASRDERRAARESTGAPSTGRGRCTHPPSAAAAPAAGRNA